MKKEKVNKEVSYLFRIESSLLNRIKNSAKRNDRSVSAEIRHAIRSYLNKFRE